MVGGKQKDSHERRGKLGVLTVKIKKAPELIEKWKLEKSEDFEEIIVKEGDTLTEVEITALTAATLFHQLTGLTLIPSDEAAQSLLSFQPVGPATEYDLAEAILQAAREKGFGFEADAEFSRLIKWQVKDREKVQTHLKEVSKTVSGKGKTRRRLIPTRRTRSGDGSDGPQKRPRYVPKARD